ncbi:NADPH-dependent 2,4-dienoyl-CoA reductase, sulfur reductase [Alteribacillus persepolensis]|uniref:NADPH-dependent 2,4-dienoyl-CoA reductase, sulfur reductase n=1 Tax=Alteribacillus persepolensis TaxID=568899 RepID=A0A1G8HDI1_9BACI|nr:FAD-dependent oxidoreductase [Alteribacillus persepolensis]SDI04581.1 NADPH-dependent 2,4-dienoyl-CoA reductase, sulfur reductase [Alteribacillus persepolensis]
MDYVIIGGDAAGMSAAMQIVRKDEKANVTTLERGGIYSYAQCGLPYIIGGAVESTDDLIAREVDTFRNKHGIDARTFHEVTDVDIEKKLVKGMDLQHNQPFEIPYDKLLIASGASPVVPDWEGRNLHNIHTLKTIPDIKEIAADLDGVSDVTIIGGGYVGLELAENFIETGRHVRIIERNNRLAKMFDEDMGELILEEAKKHGVELCLEESVESFTGTDQVEAVVTDQNTYQTDMVIVAAGIKPNTEFLQKTNVHVEDNGAVKVNRYMQTNEKDVYAAGDCAVQYHRIKEKDDYVPLGTHANKQGRTAGLNMIGKPKAFQGILGTSILRFFDLTLAKTGLNEAEADDIGFAYDTVTNKTVNIAGYFAGKTALHVKLLYRTDNDMVIGGQVIGKDGADKRIDVLATALFHHMTLSDFEDLDLSYAPPYNGVWDPIQQTVRRAT